MRALRIVPAALLLCVACAEEGREVRAGLSLAEAMGGDTAGYRRAIEPRTFTFPDDHGPHPGFRVEWWYFTGNLSSDDGRRFGFQLTYFRSAQTPAPAARTSAWAAEDLWMAHFALTDAGAGRFHAFERFARGAAGLAGATARPFRVHLEDWSVESLDSARPFPVRLDVDAGDVVLDLVLDDGRPFVLQGDGGLSAKGPEPGNASYYYSLTRLPARGVVRTGDARFDVRGSAWMDREWSTSALGEDLVGWDWFAIQLDDGTDLMLYQLRRADGSASPFSAGTLVPPDGEPIHLDADDFTLVPEGTWSSPLGDADYPAAWRARIPGRNVDVRVTPVLAAQELDVTVRYWEGAVDVSGTHDGVGYLEMTGYVDGQTARSRGPAAERDAR